MAGFNMSDYVDVAERIAEFAAKYPDGSLQSDLTPMERDGVLVGWFCRAYAYRSPSDERPGVGHAVESVPGKTPYTRDSEAMNAETSAWGRAIIALGFRTKKIASRQEVEARDESSAGTGEAKPSSRRPAAEEAPTGAAPAADGPYASEAQRKRLFAIKKQVGLDDAGLRAIIGEVTGQESTAQIPRGQYDAVVAAVESWVPFQ